MMDEKPTPDMAPPRSPSADDAEGVVRKDAAPIAEEARGRISTARLVVGPTTIPLEDATPRATRPMASSGEPSRRAVLGLAPALAVASPKGGSGKTTIALNLAVALARTGRDVILVDCDPNGDVLSALSARERPSLGVYDVLENALDPSTVLLRTVLPSLRILPALGRGLPADLLRRPPRIAQWQRMIGRLREISDLVVCDTPAGLFGVSADILQSVTHTIGVLQAQTIPKRSFEMFERAITAMQARPEVLGVVVNMFDRSSSGSLAVLAEAAGAMPYRLLETTIPRATAIESACEAGMPLQYLAAEAPAVAWLFEMLAEEVRAGLRLDSVARPVAASFLV
jgi:chromosome partitioning protein